MPWFWNWLMALKAPKPPKPPQITKGVATPTAPVIVSAQATP